MKLVSDLRPYEVDYSTAYNGGWYVRGPNYYRGYGSDREFANRMATALNSAYQLGAADTLITNINCIMGKKGE